MNWLFRPAPQTGWLIEDAAGETSRPRYWRGAPRAAGGEAWTEDHRQAIRFARRLDATRVSARSMLGATRIYEHAWGIG